MKKCFIFGCCTGYSKKRKDPKSKVATFSVPKDETLFCLWKQAAKRGRTDKKLSKEDFICSNHFREKDIIKGYYINDVFYPRTRWDLKEGAVPILGKGTYKFFNLI